MVLFLVSPMHRCVEPTGFPQKTVSSRGRNPAAAVCGDFPGPVPFQRSEPRVQDGGAGSLCHHTEYPDAARADPSKGEALHLPPEHTVESAGFETRLDQGGCDWGLGEVSDTLILFFHNYI